MKADGAVVAALSDASIDLSAEANVVSAAVGAQHVVLMHRDGTAAGYGANDDLQCAVDRFFLRPHVEGAFLIGFRPGMTIAEATTVLKAVSYTHLSLRLVEQRYSSTDCPSLCSVRTRISSGKSFTPIMPPGLTMAAYSRMLASWRTLPG